MDTPYRGRVILSTSSRIVSILSFDSFGSVAVLGTSDDNHVHKVSDFKFISKLLQYFINKCMLINCFIKIINTFENTTLYI